MEWEWVVTLATLEPDDVIYTDFVDVAREFVPELFNMRYGNHPLINFYAIHVHDYSFCVSTVYMYCTIKNCYFCLPGAYEGKECTSRIIKK